VGRVLNTHSPPPADDDKFGLCPQTLGFLIFLVTSEYPCNREVLGPSTFWFQGKWIYWNAVDMPATVSEGVVNKYGTCKRYDANDR
jgi:hypothetical protein